MKAQECSVSSVSSRLRLGITLLIVLMVILSPVVILTNPVVLKAKGNNIDTSGQHSGFSLVDRSTPTPMSAPSANLSPLDSDFTTQAALTSPSTKQTNNIVNTQSEFAVTFKTSTTGVIKKILVTFPAGTNIGSVNLLITREGIGPGVAEKTSSTTITYTVTDAVSVPAGRLIKLEFGTIVNAPNPGNQFVTVSTRTASNAIIDGPTAIGYSLKQIGTADIADGAITTTKIGDDTLIPQTLRVYSLAKSVPPQSTNNAPAFAVCPSTHPTITGGGFHVASPVGEPFMHAIESEQSGNAWVADMYNSHPSEAFNFVASATCMAPMP